MIAFDTVAAALAAADPHTEMDRLVRAELAVGRTTADIYSELLPLVTSVRAAGGLTKDAQAALAGTLDALTGDCDPDQAYQDPPALPTEEEIARLPRWARVAYAARSVRRVLPIFGHNWPDAPPAYQNRVNWMVEAAEQAAELGTTGDAPLSPLMFAAYACDAIFNSNRDRRRVAEVLTVNRSKVAGLPEANTDVVAYVVRTCAHNAAVAAAHAVADSRETYPTALEAMEAIFRSDFSVLQRLAFAHSWTDDTPIPASMFGPLWPGGIPGRWPNIQPNDRDDTSMPSVGKLVTQLR